MIHPGLALGLAYLAGSIPAAYLAGKAHGVDLRKHGSGNLGATNVLRVLGWKTGLAVYLFDTLKGALPVVLLPALAGVPRGGLWAIGFGVAAILGHVRPIFLLGKGGGKGVATAGGVFLGLAPVPMLITVAVFALVVKLSGYVSLGSLCAAVAMPIALYALHGMHSYVFALSLVVGVFVFWTHRANIGRLRRGEEHRFGRKRGPGSDGDAGRPAEVR